MADNLEQPIAAGTKLASKDIGGVQYPRNLLVDETSVDAMGAVSSSPAANTLLGRLKAIADAITTRLPASLGGKLGSASLSVVPASDGFAVTAPALDSSDEYVPVTLSSSNLADGACRAIVAGTAGVVNLKQPDGTLRENFPLFAGLNVVQALMIGNPTSGTAAQNVWALY